MADWDRGQTGSKAGTAAALPVAFGLGIAIYFTADREPPWWAGSGLAALCCVVAILARHRPLAFPLALGFTAVVTGFAVATLKTVQIAHPVLARPAGNVAVAGFVEVREERERTDRIEQKPDRVCVSVKKGRAPPVGSYVTFRARLSPPLEPLRPGGYDFARDLYIQGIGATGFVLGAIRPAEAPSPPGLWLKYAASIQDLRDAIDARIRAAIPGDKGAISSALITGKRDAISAPGLRALLALAPGLASRRPIKKWSAVGALIAAFGYLLLSGSEVATQRSFIMTAVVLIGVMADRPALTLRTLALAAFGVLLLAPQSVVHPSFQMSFAATLALIAAYERGLPWTTANADISMVPGWRCGVAGKSSHSYLRLWLRISPQHFEQHSIFAV